MPSNYAQEELSAHTKTLEAQSLGMFTLSDEKNEFYAKEIARYRSMYEKCVFIEERDGITPEGYPK